MKKTFLIESRTIEGQQGISGRCMVTETDGRYLLLDKRNGTLLLQTSES